MTTTEQIIDIFYYYAHLVAEVRNQQAIIEQLTERLNQLVPPPAKDGKPRSSAGIATEGPPQTGAPHSVT